MASRKRKGFVATATAAALAVLATVVVQVVQPKGEFYETSRTRDIKYQVVPDQWDRWGPVAGLDASIAKARDLLDNHQGGGYRIKKKGDADWGQLRNLSETLDAYRDRLRNGGFAVVFLILAEDDGYKVRGRRVDANPAVMSDLHNGTVSARMIDATVRFYFPNARFMGMYVCKSISGGSNLSQHAFGNAVDFGAPLEWGWGSTKSIQFIDQVVAFVDRLRLQGKLPVSQVLWRGVANHYPGHVHFSGAPLLNYSTCGVR